MSPRRPRVPRVDPSTGAPRRTTSDVEAEAGKAADAGHAAPADPPERPATAEVIDLQRAQDRRQAGPEPHDRAPGLDPKGADVESGGPAGDDRRGSTPAPAAASASRPAAASSSSARPGARRPRPAPRRALSPAAAAARRRAPLPDPVPARQITGRSLVVVAVLLVAAVLVAPTLRAFLNQQLEISAAEEEIAALQAQRADYEERLRLWDDPGYVTQQARERLELVMPGETLYAVTGLPDEDGGDPAPETPAGEAVNTRLPWAQGLWDSAVRAGLE